MLREAGASSTQHLARSAFVVRSPLPSAFLGRGLQTTRIRSETFMPEILQLFASRFIYPALASDEARAAAARAALEAASKPATPDRYAGK